MNDGCGDRPGRQALVEPDHRLIPRHRRLRLGRSARHASSRRTWRSTDPTPPPVAAAATGAHTGTVTIAETRQPDLSEATDDIDWSSVDFAAVEFTDVPAADASAVVDPHWLELRGDSLLPSLYMPPTMPGERSTLMRLVSTALIGVFMLATTLGICLTYGPPPT
jgi:hypothetical protein